MVNCYMNLEWHEWVLREITSHMYNSSNGDIIKIDKRRYKRGEFDKSVTFNRRNSFRRFQFPLTTIHLFSRFSNLLKPSKMTLTTLNSRPRIQLPPPLWWKSLPAKPSLQVVKRSSAWLSSCTYCDYPKHEDIARWKRKKHQTLRSGSWNKGVENPKERLTKKNSWVQEIRTWSIVARG